MCLYPSYPNGYRWNYILWVDYKGRNKKIGMDYKFNEEQKNYLLDFITSNYFKGVIIKELKIKLEANQGILDSYQLSDDLYFCDSERENIRIIKSIFDVMGVKY